MLARALFMRPVHHEVELRKLLSVDVIACKLFNFASSNCIRSDIMVFIGLGVGLRAGIRIGLRIRSDTIKAVSFL